MMQSFSSTPKQKYTKNYSHSMKSFIRIVSLGLVLFSSINHVKTEEIPTDLVYPIVGCGSSCRTNQISISYPEILNNGWIAVKVLRKHYFINHNPFYYDKEKGEEGYFSRTVIWIPKFRKEWVFANCSEGLYGSGGINKDMSDSRIRSIFSFDRDGKKRLNTYRPSGYIFQHWKKLCN